VIKKLAKYVILSLLLSFCACDPSLAPEEENEIGGFTVTAIVDGDWSEDFRFFKFRWYYTVTMVEDIEVDSVWFHGYVFEYGTLGGINYLGDVLEDHKALIWPGDTLSKYDEQDRKWDYLDYSRGITLADSVFSYFGSYWATPGVSYK